jgi:hypothetical protein
MGQYRMGPPEALILALQRRLGLGDFIETGTYRGDTAAWAAGHFARVTTIELAPAYHAAAQARFRAQPKVRALGGESSAVLREVVPALAGPALFWLDAHWSGLDTAGRDAECPLLAEIALINAAPCVHTVMVDDARLFCSPPPRPHRAEQWPDLTATVAALNSHDRRYVVLFEDALVAVPSAEREFLNTWLQDAHAMARGRSPLVRWWRKLRT